MDSVAFIWLRRETFFYAKPAHPILNQRFYHLEPLTLPLYNTAAGCRIVKNAIIHTTRNKSKDQMPRKLFSSNQIKWMTTKKAWASSIYFPTFRQS
jgi:hypothetical protein